MEKFGVYEGLEKELILRMLRLGYGLEGNKVEEHLDKLLEDMNTSI